MWESTYLAIVGLGLGLALALALGLALDLLQGTLINVKKNIHTVLVLSGNIRSSDEHVSNRTMISWMSSLTCAMSVWSRVVNVSHDQDLCCCTFSKSKDTHDVMVL